MTGTLLPGGALAPLLLGPLGAPPVLVVALFALLLAVLLGRVVLGVAWKFLLVALAVALGLWLLGTLRTVLVIV